MIDLRSDTVTRPDAGMRQAMAQAEVGDDVFGEDPTANRLQESIAERLGKEAALFVPSGSMGNQVCLRVHTAPGDEVICEAGAHIVNYEAGSMPLLSGIQPRPLTGRNGIITLEQIQEAVRPQAYYYPRTRVVALEITHNLAGGTIFPLADIEQISRFCRSNGLSLHLDGARLWNACVATGIAPARYAECFDSVTVCLSKGLGAPAGSVIAGSEAFICEARRVRKQFGGGMRQIGILAAAGLYALEQNLDRLAHDHEKAKQFARIVSNCASLAVLPETVQTNIVIMGVKIDRPAEQICAELRGMGVLIVPMGHTSLRAVTHLDVTEEQVKRAAELMCKYFESV